MTNLIDPIERLRVERPDVDSAPRRAIHGNVRDASRTSRRAPRRWSLQLGIAATVAVVIVMSGAITLRSSEDGVARIAPGITAAEAREQAINALKGIGQLRDFTYSSEHLVEEPGGDKRSLASGWTYSRIGGDSEISRWTRNDFGGIQRRDGLGERLVDGYRYETTGFTRAIDEPWLLDVRGGWSAPGTGRMALISSWLAPQPDFDALVAQLEREGLIDARREEDGTIVVEIERPAKELAPVTSSVSGNDPISIFAMSVAQTGPDRPVTIRLTLGTDGSLRRLNATATGPATVPDGNGGLEIEARTSVVHTWEPRHAPILKPDPKDVMVVGDAMHARQGMKGPRGPLGTLDTLTLDDLRRLRSAAKASRVPPRASTRPTRSYPKLFARRRAEQRAFRRVVAGMMPFDRAAFANDDGCVPLWPDSRRAMARTTADADPEAAGWKCELAEDLGTVVIMPAPSGLVEWSPASGGATSFGSRGYQPR